MPAKQRKPSDEKYPLKLTAKQREKVLEPVPNVAYPRCIEGARACPPEDVGGIWGYAEFLEAISDPDHANHDEMLEWIGGQFDLEKFSADVVNKELE